MSQLARLARPFPEKFVHTNPSGGGHYVTHSVVNEKLLAVVGPFTFELVEIVRGDVPEILPNPQGKSQRAKSGMPALSGAVVGAVCRLTVTVDDTQVSIEEVGDCEQPHNWPHDGARLKDAMSDALKRCAMRLGVGLHLWSQHEFTLYEQLAGRAGTEQPQAASSGVTQQAAPTEGMDGGHLSGPAHLDARVRACVCGHPEQTHDEGGCRGVVVAGEPNVAGADRECRCVQFRPAYLEARTR